ncbi:sperm surface protein Sp17 [Cylas formicarius]|uniref:sperm surface protein Sp17 n=1 Tax=Cylas formicarius TaxID=197179 RepID=UPI00295878AB|nr:sperm surface protein Sp17 [Cylas formicarius]
MNVSLQKYQARYLYAVPEGLRELMADISREVLRSQPQDLHTFIADYLDALIITRENARVASRVVQSLTDTAQAAAAFFVETGLGKHQVDLLVQAMKKSFAKRVCDTSQEVEEANVVSEVINEAKIEPEEAETAALVIQQAYRRYKEKVVKERELLEGVIDWRVAARSAIRLYRRTGVTNEEANRAATMIKAAYKGYYTRKALKKMSVLSVAESGSSVGRTTLGDERKVTINYDTVIQHVDFDVAEMEDSRDDFTAESRLS